MNSEHINPEVRNRLRQVRGFVCDLDGTLVLGDKRNHGIKPLPGGAEFVGWLNEHDIPFVLFTNGTLRDRKSVV